MVHYFKNSLCTWNPKTAFKTATVTFVHFLKLQNTYFSCFYAPHQFCLGDQQVQELWLKMKPFTIPKSKRNHMNQNIFSAWRLQAQNMLRTIYVHNMCCACSEHVLSLQFSWTELLIQWTIFLSYCGLVDARISVSEKDLPVLLFICVLQFEVQN